MADLKTSVSIELVDKLTKPLKDVKKEIGGVAQSQKKLTENTKKSNNETGKQTKELKDLGETAKKTKGNIGDLATGFTNLVAGMGISSKLKNAINEAGNREALNFRLETVLKGGSSSEIESFVNNLAISGIDSYANLMETSYALLSAGISEGETKVGTEIAAKIAALTQGHSADIANIMATAAKDFKIPMNEVGDILAKTQNIFQIKDFHQLEEGLKYVAAAASSINLPLEQASSLIGTLNDAGLMGSMAGTGTAGILSSVSKASKELGIAIPKAKDGSIDLVSWIGLVQDELNDMFKGDELGQFDALQSLFGEAGARSFLILSTRSEELKEKLHELKDASGFVDDKSAKYMVLYDTKVMALTNSLAGFASTIGTAVIPHMVKLIDFITPIINATADYISKNEWLGQALFYTGVALAGVVTVLGAMSILRFVGSQFLFLGKASMFAAGFMKTFFSLAIWGTRMLSIGFIQLGIAIMTTPIGWILGGIALIAGGAYLIIKHWKPAGDFFTSFWESIKASVKTVYDWLLKYIIEPITAIWDKVKGFFGSSKIDTTSKEIKEVKNNIEPIQPQSTKQNKVDGNIVYNNTFNINGSNLNANEIAETVIQKLQKQNRTSLAGS